MYCTISLKIKTSISSTTSYLRNHRNFIMNLKLSGDTYAELESDNIEVIQLQCFQLVSLVIVRILICWRYQSGCSIIRLFSDRCLKNRHKIFFCFNKLHDKAINNNPANIQALKKNVINIIFSLHWFSLIYIKNDQLTWYKMCQHF